MTPPSLTRGTTQLLEVLQPPLFPAGPLPTKLYPVDAPVRATVEGQAGTWILFDNNLPHIGVAPTTAYRVVCEVTVETMKKEVFDLYPIFGGFGAQYEINLLKKYPKTKRNPEERAHAKTEEHHRIARQFEKDFFDGDRAVGYGGYSIGQNSGKEP